jgi:tetratricopeptide (TPR) repeat protein
MGDGYLPQMNAHVGTMVDRNERNSARRRQATVVAAARVVSIDYRSIVERAVAGLDRNTPDGRREVYAQARAVVQRHLHLMRLPDPIVELEKLALDLTIRKIEEQVRAQQSVEDAFRDVTTTRWPAAGTVPQALASLAKALAEVAWTFASLILVVCWRSVVSAFLIVAFPLRMMLRPLASPVGLAAVLPIAAMAIFVAFFVDYNTAYRSLADGPAARWLSRLEFSQVVPIARTASPERLQAPLEPPSNAGTAPPPPLAASATYRGATRVRPVRAEFAAAPAVRATDSVEPFMQPKSTAPQAGSTLDRPPGWLADYSGVANTASTPSSTATEPMPSEALAARSEAEAAAPQGPEAVKEEARSDAIASPPDGSAAPPAPAAEAEAAPSAPEAPVAPAAFAPAPPADPKVAALMHSGRQAASTGDLERAIRDFSEAIKIDPKYAYGYSDRGQALFKKGETDRAITDFTAAIQRDPQHGAALRARAMAYLRRGTPDPALADLTQAIRLAEGKPSRLAPIELFEARRTRASLYGAKQQYEQAIADSTAIIDAYANDPALAEALKSNYRDAGAADVVAAVYRQRAKAYMQTPAVSGGWKRRLNLDRAAADLSAAMPLSSDRGFAALVERAQLNEALGQDDQAIADLKTALGIKPDSEEARSGLRRLGVTPPPLPNAAPGQAIPTPRPRPAPPLPLLPTAG